MVTEEEEKRRFAHAQTEVIRALPILFGSSEDIAAVSPALMRQIVDSVAALLVKEIYGAHLDCATTEDLLEELIKRARTESALVQALLDIRYGLSSEELSYKRLADDGSK
jgi:hypothetical protein